MKNIIVIACVIALLLVSCRPVFIGPYKITADNKTWYCESYYTDTAQNGTLVVTMYTCKGSYAEKQDCKIVISGVQEFQVERIGE